MIFWVLNGMIFWVLVVLGVGQLATMVYVWILLNRIGRILGDVAAILNDIKAEIESIRSILASVITP